MPYLRKPLVELADRCRLILPDLRGCGRSTRGLADDRYTPDAVVADLVALLDALGVARADVLGFSYGGLIAQRLTLAARTAPTSPRLLAGGPAWQQQNGTASPYADPAHALLRRACAGPYFCG